MIGHGMDAAGQVGSLASVFRTLNDLRERRVVTDYAIGGGTVDRDALTAILARHRIAVEIPADA